MNLKHITFVSLLSLGLSASAANPKKTVTQVTDAVTIMEDVDYVITNTTPFGAMGSVNIENTEHAVVIIKGMKPSKVISSQMSHIYIKGEKAVNGTNCQVKMYDRGAIIFPYESTFKPLTCFTEPDFAGESCNDYSEGHSGGYMKTLNATTLNNNFQSFKLKRGYMVTFALGTGGWGYSRCFIADQEDLEMNLPKNMAGRVSSYRLFKWHNAHKAGLASDGRAAANAAVGSCWCYDWGQGNSSLLPDVEWVPNHIYEDWPSSSTCGSVDGSCHMKTNNEPGNSADDHPQDVETILNNWQNLMRTGMRLCSESSHDGSWNHLKEFIRQIDARGWRCDLLDLHCYWPAGSFGDFSNYYNDYGGRPIWISEWVWGASWNNNGAFAVANRGDFNGNQNNTYNGTVPILEKLNASKYVERYAYWNSEADCSKIYKDGTLSKLGQYYANMNEGLGYNASIQKVPNVVYVAPKGLAGTYAKAKGTYTITWTDDNGDMLDSVVVEAKLPGTTKFIRVATLAPKDKTTAAGASYSYTHDIDGTGAYYFRVGSYPIGTKTANYSEEVSMTASASTGTSEFQTGVINITNLDVITTNFSENFDEVPSVFMGVCSSKNTNLYPGNLLTNIGKTKFSYQVVPWKKQSNSIVTVTNAEEIPFMALKAGTYKFGDLDAVVGTAKVKQDTAIVEFEQAFPEDVTPIVLTELRNPSLKTNPIAISVWDVTNKGFKCLIRYEEGIGSSINVFQNVSYFAVTPGLGTIDKENGIMIAAGKGENNLYGTTYKLCTFTDGNDTLYFKSPKVFARCQTNNYPANAILRKVSDIIVTDKTSDRYNMVYGCRIRRMTDGTTTTTEKNVSTNSDVLGYVVIASYAEGSTVPTAIGDITEHCEGIAKPSVSNGIISVSGVSDIEVFSTSGAKMNPKAAQQPGIYVVRFADKSAKVIVR